MDYDERDRPDDVGSATPRPDDSPAEQADAPERSDLGDTGAIADAGLASGAEPAPEPIAPDWSTDQPASSADEPAPSAAEIESWPSQDTAPISSGAIDDRTAWPTEPPAAGSAPPDAWPTS